MSSNGNVLGQWAMNSINQVDAFDLLNGLPDQSVDCILTDPPYGVTRADWDKRPDLPHLWAEFRRVVKRGRGVIMTASQPFTSVLVCSNLAEFRHEWIWEKSNGSNFLNVRHEPFKTHESVVVFGVQKVFYAPVMVPGLPYRSKRRANRSELYGQHRATESINNGERYPRSVVRIQNERGLHPTQKPVQLFEYLLRTYTEEGDVVVDPYVGSGTTAVAAANLGRRYIVGETNPKYFSIACMRMADLKRRNERED